MTASRLGGSEARLELERANHSATPSTVKRNNEGNARRDESEGGGGTDADRDRLRPSTSGTV